MTTTFITGRSKLWVVKRKREIYRRVPNVLLEYRYRKAVGTRHTIN